MNVTLVTIRTFRFLKKDNISAILYNSGPVSYPIGFSSEMNMWNFPWGLPGIPCEILRGFPRKYVPDLCFKLYGDFRGFHGNSMGFHGIPWRLHRIPWNPTESSTNSMESPWIISDVHFPMEIPWGMKPRPLFCRIANNSCEWCYLC